MERIFYGTDYRDPITNYPIYIFDTSYLPSTEVIDYNELIPTLMQCLPLKPYVLVIFSSGLNRISWLWGLKFIKNFMMVDNNSGYNLRNLVKIFLVHDSWFIKSVTSMLYNYNSTRKNLVMLNKLMDTFSLNSDGLGGQTEVIHCNNLSQLSEYLDITKLKTSLNVYEYDFQLEESIKLSMKLTPTINPYVTLSPVKHPLFYHHIYQFFHIIDSNGSKVELLFYKPGKKAKIDILYQCLLRNQLIWINDWDLYSISTTFKRLLSELPHPLIPMDEIILPVEDNFEFTSGIFQKINIRHRCCQQTENYDTLLLQLFECFHELILNEAVTKHTSSTIGKCMSHCLSQTVVSSDNSDTQIISRFIKNVLEHWEQIRGSFEFPSVEDIVFGNYQETSMVEDSFDESYDITFQDENNDNESRIAFNTRSMLSENTKLRSREVESDDVSTLKSSKSSSSSSVHSGSSSSILNDDSSPRLATIRRRSSSSSLTKPKLPERKSRSSTSITRLNAESSLQRTSETRPPVLQKKKSSSKHGTGAGAPPPTLPSRKREVLFEAEDILSNSSPSEDKIIDSSETKVCGVEDTKKPRSKESSEAKEAKDDDIAKNKQEQSSPTKDKDQAAPKPPLSNKSTKTAKNNFENGHVTKSTASVAPSDQPVIPRPELRFNPAKSTASAFQSSNKDNYTPSNRSKSFNKITSASAAAAATTAAAFSKFSEPASMNGKTPITPKKLVIRGRKVSQLAKLFEERREGIDILKSM
ncbi:uncharacterized protein LODBEIA_P15210 [Lodderomyces beijingensis]|uniref:Rho-GAP domain-containing protein n=1 Tax=Lodderomyces beijingensis TaxID=1775926 RepID=A0ABP0ZIM5_9ASCO